MQLHLAPFRHLQFMTLTVDTKNQMFESHYSSITFKIKVRKNSFNTVHYCNTAVYRYLDVF